MTSVSSRKKQEPQKGARASLPAWGRVKDNVWARKRWINIANVMSFPVLGNCQLSGSVFLAKVG